MVIHPERTEELKPVLVELSRCWQPGDRLYVYNGSGDYGAGPAFAFYGPGYGLPAESVILGRTHRNDPAKYVEDIRGIEGPGRVWLLMSHEHKDEAAILHAAFDGIGTRGEKIVRTGSAAYAYGITNTPRP